MTSQRHTGLAPEFVEYVPAEREPGVLYISERFSTAIHSCACGCGATTVTPFGTPDVWDLTVHDDGTVTLSPSIGNGAFPCRSHYFIRRNRIDWLPPMGTPRRSS